MPVALISDSQIQQVFASREAMDGKYHPDFIAQLIDIPDDVKPGYWQTETGWSKSPPAPAPTVDDFAAAVQAHVDTTARSKGYGDGFGLSTYVNSTLPQWAAEAAAFVAWRDAVWIYAYSEFAKVQAGQRALPSIEDLIAELPQIKWP